MLILLVLQVGERLQQVATDSGSAIGLSVTAVSGANGNIRIALVDDEDITTAVTGPIDFDGDVLTHSD